LVPEGLKFVIGEQERTVRPQSVPELLTYWYWPVGATDKDYRFGHLVLLLRGVRDIGMLGGMLACNLDEFLDAAGPLSSDELRSRPTAPESQAIRFLQIDTGILVNESERNIGSSLTTLPLYHVSRNFAGWGSWIDAPDADSPEGSPEGKIGLTILSMPEISHLELRLHDHFWIKPLNNEAPVELPAGMELTLGDLLQVIFLELSWFSADPVIE